MKHTDDRRVEAGHFYEATRDGLKLTSPATPDVWICRRVADFPHGVAPAGAAVARCARCHAEIAYNPGRVLTVPPDTPQICMQCASIQPLPIEP